MMSDEKNARDAKRERRAFDARRTTRSCAWEQDPDRRAMLTLSIAPRPRSRWCACG